MKSNRVEVEGAFVVPALAGKSSHVRCWALAGTLVVVPAAERKTAQAILAGLPISVETDRDIWRFNSSPRVKAGMEIYAWVCLALFGLVTLGRLIYLGFFLPKR